MLKNTHPEKPVFEYSKIAKYIYIGTNMCCQPHFSKSLLKKGIKADISLEEIKLDKPFGVEYYLWLSTKDHKAPSFKQLIIGGNFIKLLIDNKIKVYIHCQHGHARSFSLVTAYFIIIGMSVKEAIGFIKKKRPNEHLNKYQEQALINFYINKKEVKQNGNKNSMESICMDFNNLRFISLFNWMDGLISRNCILEHTK